MTETPQLLIPVRIEQYIHGLINRERTSHGLVQLAYDTSLADIARNHSRDMTQRSYFSHCSPEGRDPTARARLAGYNCQKQRGRMIYTGVAENIFMTDIFAGRQILWETTVIGGREQSRTQRTITNWLSNEEIASSAVSGWMKSEGHRENILTPHHEREGLGVYVGNEKAYVTQLFF